MPLANMDSAVGANVRAMPLPCAIIRKGHCYMRPSRGSGPSDPMITLMTIGRPPLIRFILPGRSPMPLTQGIVRSL